MSEEQAPKKVSLAEAMKQRLAQKKQQAHEKDSQKGNQATKVLKTQNNKKPNNQRRRTGGS
ncbi:hypothetical protein JNUCC42_05050 [Brevibacterium sp. JNUCC-42]|uniref:Uncharacterized protein n=1 Tax=Brevibacillus laterosporus TaxID=1465 RepID=A0A502J1D6_BRELA|nr:hypothetical protein [Brevibacillus laterosporus]QOT00108.1 hypothetical protein JNUCC42_05050 [Brevibacterium sp. JNUCC-42]QDX94474.1 hypothetical protein EEL30_20610 [Brevibacillus laterosporus]RAP30973.1 hypothetical protein C2W64_00145 [Brevibacillus laterosporus]TPG68363.1 hypothetical protein EEL31_07365 [Brevibacillus laterosporus]TPG92951.1 hypothetical protein EEL32_00855 [Brevibacillus laterosporus]